MAIHVHYNTFMPVFNTNYQMRLLKTNELNGMESEFVYSAFLFRNLLNFFILNKNLSQLVRKQ